MLLETRIPASYLVRQIRLDLLYVLLIAGVVELWLTFFAAALPPVPPSIPTFLGTSISLILSFKLNQSYDRWWEARKIWGAIVNDSRTLVRQLLSFSEKAESDRVRCFAMRQVAWCFALGQSLRGLDWREPASKYLTNEDTEELQHHMNKPLALLQLHAGDVSALAREGLLTDYQRVTLDDTLTRLTDSQGKAERIRNTVFPRTYRLLLHGFIYLFVTLLSVALAELQGLWQVALTTIISAPFFWLEKTATEIQDPFGNRPTDTSMTAIAQTIQVNIRQLLGERGVAPPAPPAGFYVM